ncbi:MAG: tetratricopeptide repeat protein [Betaproteobacteria bacterium]
MRSDSAVPGDAGNAGAAAEPEPIAALRRAARNSSGEPQLEHWRALAAASPGDSEALFILGNDARNRGDFAHAARHYEAALESTPDHGGLLNNLGLAYEKMARLDDAESQFRHALALAPDGLQPLANLAQNLFQQRRYADAVEFFDRLTSRYPQLPHASIHGNRGLCLTLVGRLRDAEASLARAMEIDPSLTTLARNRGLLLVAQGKWPAATPLLETAAAADPSDMFAASSLEHCRANNADWRDGGAGMRRILDAMRDPERRDQIRVMPLDILAQSDDLGLQRIATRSWAALPLAAPTVPDAGRNRLHLGFVSTDFCNHPVARLLLGLLDKLDRSRFEVTNIAIAPQRLDDEILARSKLACDRYIEIGKGASPEDNATRLRALGVDVLFDLNGITGASLPALFAHRTAPMQVNFLGYTATLDGATHDYIIADSYCIPEDASSQYAERVLRLDPCYLPSDAARTLADPLPSRADYGLPENAFVLAMFGASFKIKPDMFARWMSIMRAHPETVMWLRPTFPVIAGNLRSAAETAGIAASRLIFAPEDRISSYLARFRLADLVLDTFPFGSHTTVNDALFAGAPVLALAGRSFAARASASQLVTMGLHELVADTPDDYECLAHALIADRARLAQLSARVRSAEARRALFDMDRYAEEFAGLVFAGWRALAQTRSAP